MSRRGRQGCPFVVGQFIARPLLARNVCLALEEQHLLPTNTHPPIYIRSLSCLDRNHHQRYKERLATEVYL